MATQISHSFGINPPDSTPKRNSAPTVPIMVVVTDVDNDSEEVNPGQVSHSDSQQSLYVRLTRNFLRNDRRESSANSVTAWNSSEKMAKKVPSEQETGLKPATHGQWRKICKCFNGLRMKKKKNGTAENHSIEVDTLSPSLFPSSWRRSPDLRGRMSVSPARSESDFYLCDMASVSEILTIQDVKQLGKEFPPSAVGCPCVLTFSTSEDGFSLHSLYRKMARIDSPVIIVIQDSKGRSFGAMLSCALKVSEHFYGSCDSFLFRGGPSIEIFKWQEGGNRYFIHSEENFLRIGAGDGKCGLWLDDNLFHGRSEECATFRSSPLVEEQDFEIKTVECWTFGQI